LARERIELGALELVFAGGLALFGAWVALSNLWTPSVPSAMRGVQRELACIGVVATGLLEVRANGVCRRGRVVQLVDAVGRVHPGQVVREQPGVAGVTGTSCPRSASTIALTFDAANRIPYLSSICRQTSTTASAPSSSSNGTPSDQAPFSSENSPSSRWTRASGPHSNDTRSH
jgi:hypothetical protein